MDLKKETLAAALVAAGAVLCIQVRCKLGCFAGVHVPDIWRACFTACTRPSHLIFLLQAASIAIYKYFQRKVEKTARSVR